VLRFRHGNKISIEPMENPSSPKAKKACQVRSNVKIMLISFFGANGILHEGI